MSKIKDQFSWLNLKLTSWHKESPVFEVTPEIKHWCNLITNTRLNDSAAHAMAICALFFNADLNYKCLQHPLANLIWLMERGSVKLMVHHSAEKIGEIRYSSYNHFAADAAVLTKQYSDNEIIIVGWTTKVIFVKQSRAKAVRNKDFSSFSVDENGLLPPNGLNWRLDALTCEAALPKFSATGVH